MTREEIKKELQNTADDMSARGKDFAMIMLFLLGEIKAFRMMGLLSSNDRIIDEINI